MDGWFKPDAGRVGGRRTPVKEWFMFALMQIRGGEEWEGEENGGAFTSGLGQRKPGPPERVENPPKFGAERKRRSGWEVQI